MSNVQAALTRKFGPLPAWGWAAILAVVVYFYRKRMAGTSGGSGGGDTSGTNPSYYGPYGQNAFPIDSTGGGTSGGGGNVAPVDTSGSGNPAGGPPVINILPPDHASTDTPATPANPGASTIKRTAKPKTQHTPKAKPKPAPKRPRHPATVHTPAPRPKGKPTPRPTHPRATPRPQPHVSKGRPLTARKLKRK